MAQLVSAAALIRQTTGDVQVLCARRSRPQSLAGQWEFPGGKVEPNESALAAVQRELREELGVDIEVDTTLAAPGGGDWPIIAGMSMRLWLGRVLRGTPQPLQDHDELAWVPAAELTQLDWLAADIPIAAALAEHLRSQSPYR